MEESHEQLWQKILTQVFTEYRQLSEVEKQWIAERLKKVEALQQQLNDLFYAGNGMAACSHCQGDCCAKGHNHMTLVNLLSFAQRETLPPQADFTQTCPFLSEQGCRLSVEGRPYNCVTFICDTIEDALSDHDKARFYILDQQLRKLYQDFSMRYLGAAMTGLLIQERRLFGRSFFTMK